tara:strand:- start:23796 stop:25100 length:1305 start_codon:yes stop_codon:yes gene_type:complete
MDELAIFGGKPVFDKPLKRYNSIGTEELNAATEVIKSGALSPFLGDWKDIPNVGSFYGGPKVQEFERNLESYFSVKHAITVNSWTSGLICAVGAIGIEPGDEVIVSPWTMCATATAILHWCGVPVFADIDKDTFNLSPDSIRENITKYTKAIMVPDIFGHPCDMKEIMSIAKEFKLKVISDTAQAPTAKERNIFAGTEADIGGFSLNYHKHIQTGEGGVLVTNNDDYAERMQLIRNHGEAVVEGKGVKDISNIIGYNFRMGEIEAAIGIEQLKKLEGLVLNRVQIANRLTKALVKLKGIQPPLIKKDFTHSFYVYGITYNEDSNNCSRKNIFEALKAEGIPIVDSYANLHLLPMYQKKIAYGKKGFPWSSDIYKGNVSYQKGICPIAENLNDKTFLKIPLCDYELSENVVSQIIFGFEKVWKNIEKLRSLDTNL